MAEINSPSWLSQHLDVAGWSIATLAEKLDERYPGNWEERKLGGWRRCEHWVDDDNIARLADALGVDPAKLKADHDEDQGGLIGQALCRCPEAFQQKLQQKNMLGQRAAYRLRKEIRDGKLGLLPRYVNQNLIDAINQADESELQALEGFIGAVGLTAIEGELKEGQDKAFRWCLNMGEDAIYVARLWIDATIGPRITFSVAGYERPEDFTPQALRAYQVPEWDKGRARPDAQTVFLRLHEIITELVTCAGHAERHGPPPQPNAHSKPPHHKLLQYCEALNIELANLNYEDRHWFAYKLHHEPPKVQKKLDQHLPNLRLFTLDSKGESPLVRNMKPLELRNWLLRFSDHFLTRNKSMLRNFSSTLVETCPMKNQQVAGDHSTQIINYDGAAVHFHSPHHNTLNRLDQLMEVLQQIEKTASREVAEERQLRADANTIRQEHAEKKTLPANGLDWLLGHLAPGVKLGKELLDLLKRAVDLWPGSPANGEG